MTFDPTVVYLLVVVGLWAALTALYTPGTGVIEVIGLALLGVAGWALFNTPTTNWLALLLIVLGVSAFTAVPFVNQRWATIAEAGLILQGVGGFLLFEGTPPNVFVIALTLVLAWVYHRYVLVPMLRMMRNRPEAGDELNDVLGARGRVVAPVVPPNSGTAQVIGELWTVRSDRPLQKGDVVIVTEVNGLELAVEKLKNKRQQPNGTHETERSN